MYSIRPRDYFDRCFGVLAPCLAARAWCFCWFAVFVCVCFCAACFCFCFGDLSPMTQSTTAAAHNLRIILPPLTILGYGHEKTYDQRNPVTRCRGGRLAFLKAIRTLNSSFYLLTFLCRLAANVEDNCRQSRRARQTCGRGDFHHEAEDPHDVVRIVLAHYRSSYHVQPLHAAIVVHDAQLD